MIGERSRPRVLKTEVLSILRTGFSKGFIISDINSRSFGAIGSQDKRI
jgi:hypothetical protein